MADWSIFNYYLNLHVIIQEKCQKNWGVIHFQGEFIEDSVVDTKLAQQLENILPGM